MGDVDIVVDGLHSLSLTSMMSTSTSISLPTSPESILDCLKEWIEHNYWVDQLKDYLPINRTYQDTINDNPMANKLRQL